MAVLLPEVSGLPVVAAVVPVLLAVVGVDVLRVAAEEDPVAEEDNTFGTLFSIKSKDLVNARSFALSCLLHRPDLM
jgi:hypothetical protein